MQFSSSGQKPSKNCYFWVQLVQKGVSISQPQNEKQIFQEKNKLLKCFYFIKISLFWLSYELFPVLFLYHWTPMPSQNANISQLSFFPIYMRFSLKLFMKSRGEGVNNFMYTLIKGSRGSLWEHKVVSWWFGSQKIEYEVKLNIPVVLRWQMIN